MNSLEFINIIIKNSEESIKENKRVIKNFLLQDDIEKDSAIMTLESNIKFYNERLQILYKIKSELEAWYEIKDLYKKGYFSRIALPMESHEKLKKALGVEENVD